MARRFSSGFPKSFLSGCAKRTRLSSNYFRLTEGGFWWRLKVYCDANIFIDYFGKRTDGLRPLDEFAWAFFSKGWNCAFHLIVSDWLITELRKHLREEKIKEV